MGGDSSVALQGGWCLCVCVYFPLPMWLDKGQGLRGLVKNAAYCWSVLLIVECDWQTKDTLPPIEKHWVDDQAIQCGNPLENTIMSPSCDQQLTKSRICAQCCCKETVSIRRSRVMSTVCRFIPVITHMRGCLPLLEIRGHWRLCTQWQHCVDLMASCPAASSAQEGQLPVFLPHQFRGQKSTTQDWQQERNQHPAHVRPTGHPPTQCHIHAHAHTHTLMKVVHLSKSLSIITLIIICFHLSQVNKHTAVNK